MPRRLPTKTSRKPRALTKAQKKETRSIAKSTVLSLAETKVMGGQSPGSPTIPAQALFHNQPYFAGKLLACTQGAADSNDYSTLAVRIGDEILLKSINVRCMLSGFRPNVTYKLVLFWYTEGAAINNASVYFTQGNKLLDRYNTEQISIIDQKIIRPGGINRTGSDDNTVSYQRRTQLVQLNGRWKAKRIKYNEGLNTPKFKNLGWAMVAYDSVNTLQTDQLGEVVTDFKIRFKDL